MNILKLALAFTLKWEGGKVDDPQDPGGRTAYGVTQKTYNEYLKSKGLGAKDVWNISDEEKYEIYSKGYWVAAGCDKLEDHRLAISVFDFAVNGGVSRSLKYLALSPNGYDQFNQNRIGCYNKLVEKNPKLSKYIKGWTNRVNALTEYINKI